MKYAQKDLPEIFNQYKTKIYNLALKISRNTDEAQDILQNTFLKVIENLDKFRNESTLSTWIYRIAINEAYMKWRVKKRQERLVNLKKEKIYLSGEVLPAQDKEVVAQELKEEMDIAIKNLDLKYRVAIILRDYEELDYAQISRILNISLQATKTRIHRARLELRRVISEYYRDRLVKEDYRDFAKSTWQTCSRNIKFLDNLFRNELPKSNRKRFEKHIRGCGPCKKFINSYRQAIALAKCLQCRDIPQELQQRINAFLKKG